MSEDNGFDLNKEMQGYITDADIDETPSPGALYEIDFDPGNYYGKKHPTVNLIGLEGTFNITETLKLINGKFEDERAETLLNRDTSKKRGERIEKLETVLKAVSILLEAATKN